LNTLRIQGLEELVKAAKERGNAPVERWNPPYCGDIGLKIARDGTWFYQGSPIGRMKLVKLFASVLRRDEDGKHYLVTPAEKVDVTVEDAPFLAVEMEVRGNDDDERAHELVFRTNLDDVVVCGRDHPLTFVQEGEDGGLKPYVLVRGRLKALVTRAVYYDLVELASSRQPREGEGDAGSNSETIGVWSGGVFFPLEASTTGAR
jgi:uncharacterized protein